MRKLTADSLNKRGRALRQLKVGDYVKIFKPPSDAAAKRRNRKQKHMWTWDGPLIITKILGTTYDLKHKFTNKLYSRNISNIRQWRGTVPTTRPPAKNTISQHDVIMNEIEVGD